MSSEREKPDCVSVSGLIQPYVDGEVSDAERESVLAHLDVCSSCRTTTQQQQRVRAAMRELEQDLAPAALRERVLAELDRMDAENPDRRGWLAASFGRIGAFMRGGMLLAPAAAAAIGLFFVVRANVESDQLATQTTSLVEREPAPTGNEPREPRDSAKPATKLEPVEGAFEMQFAKGSALPNGIQLVGAGNAEPTRATVRFRQGDAGFLDLQTPAKQGEPRGMEQVFRGRSYYLSRDEQGRALVQFEVGDVLHELRREGPDGRVGAPVHLDEADVRRLVDLAHSLQSTGSP